MNALNCDEDMPRPPLPEVVTNRSATAVSMLKGAQRQLVVEEEEEEVVVVVVVMVMVR